MFKILDDNKVFYQWDKNRKLIIEDENIKEVHFCNRTDDIALMCEVYEQNGLRLVDVPNKLLTDKWDIKVYASDGDNTRYYDTIKVIERKKPSDYVYEETEVLTYRKLEKRLSELEVTIGDINTLLANDSTCKYYCHVKNKTEIKIETVDESVLTENLEVKLYGILGEYITSILILENTTGTTKYIETNEDVYYLELSRDEPIKVSGYIELEETEYVNSIFDYYLDCDSIKNTISKVTLDDNNNITSQTIMRGDFIIRRDDITYNDNIMLIKQRLFNGKTKTISFNQDTMERIVY